MMSNHHWLLAMAGEARPRSAVGLRPHVGLCSRGAGAASAREEEHPDVNMVADHGDIGMREAMTPHERVCGAGAGRAARRIGLSALLLVSGSACERGSTGGAGPSPTSTFRVPGTGLTTCFNDIAPMECPAPGQAFAGQDGSAPGPTPNFRANTDGTATDLNSGLTWTRAVAGPMSLSDALSSATALRTGGFDDWRLPTIKELYTLIDFGRGSFSTSATTSVPFLDTAVFDFAYAPGDRFFDVQLWSSTPYVATTMNNDATAFGVNFADGRLKGYPLSQPGSGGTVPQLMRVRYVRGSAYGTTRLTNNGDGTATDAASGLVWQVRDDGVARTWRDALASCVALRLGGASDWRLPDAKELHTIVDYTRAPAVTGEAAIAPPLQVTTVESFFWTSTTIADGPPDARFNKAAYFAFGRALGSMEMPPGSGQWQTLDVHGAGAQRADFKSGDPAAYPNGFGPQGDEVRIFNAVRCVRGGR
jgi:hypothetical protein